MSILNLLHEFIVAKKAESMTSNQIQDLQQERFRKLLRHVFQKSRFYKKYYQEHGIKDSDIEKIVPEDIPVIDKKIMMENYDDLVCDPAIKRDALEQFIAESPDAGTSYKGVYKVIHTSGSSGAIGIFTYGPRDWLVAKVIGFRVAGLSIIPFKRSRIAYIGATDGHYASITSLRNTPRILFKVLILSISSPLEQICRDISRFHPDSMIGYASGIDLLAQEQLTGNIDISPKKIWCMGEPLTPATRLNVEKAFNINPLNLYGTSETLSLAMDCNAHHRMHLFDDWFNIQIVDENIEPVNSGQPGRLVITNLFNYTQPIIRYQMDDEIILSDEPCPCGWPFRVIDKIAGRSEETLWFAKASDKREFIHPSKLGEFFVSGLEKFQFIQKDNDKLTMKAIIHGDKDRVVPAIHQRMIEILSQKGLNDTVKFDVKLVNHIPNDPKTGKFQLIIPNSDKL